MHTFQSWGIGRVSKAFSSYAIGPAVETDRDLDPHLELVFLRSLTLGCSAF
jgi:hypothetical protein